MASPPLSYSLRAQQEQIQPSPGVLQQQQPSPGAQQQHIQPSPRAPQQQPSPRAQQQIQPSPRPLQQQQSTKAQPQQIDPSPLKGATPAGTPQPSVGTRTQASPRKGTTPTGTPQPSVGRGIGGRLAPATPSAHGTPAPSESPSPEVLFGSQDSIALLASLAAGWAGSLSMGVAIGYSLPAIHSLDRARNITSAGGVSVKEVFRFDSMLPLGGLMGVLLGCFMSSVLGRRGVLAIGSLGSLASWLALAWPSAGYLHLHLARVLGGVCTGIVSLVTPAYISEIVAPEDRGKRCGAHQTGIAAGVLYTYLLGRSADLTVLAASCAVPSVLTAVLLIVAVESPRWLVEKGRRDDAEAAMRRLRRARSSADNEFQAIEVIYPKTATPIKHYILAVVIIVAQQFSGVDLIIVYATGTRQPQLGSTPYDEFIALAFFQLVVTTGAAHLLDRTGRVIPLSASVTVCTATVLLATVSYGTSRSSAVGSSWEFGLDFVSKLIFTGGFSAGLGPASWVVAVELAPLRGYGFDFGSVCAFYWTSALAVVSLFSAVENDGSLLTAIAWIFAILAFAGGVAAIIFLPLTSGLSVEDILLEGQGEKQVKKLEAGGLGGFVFVGLKE